MLFQKDTIFQCHLHFLLVFFKKFIFMSYYKKKNILNGALCATKVTSSYTKIPISTIKKKNPKEVQITRKKN